MKILCFEQDQNKIWIMNHWICTIGCPQRNPPMRLSEICMQRGLASISTNFLPRDWLCPFQGGPFSLPCRSCLSPFGIP